MTSRERIKNALNQGNQAEKTLKRKKSAWTKKQPAKEQKTENKEETKNDLPF